MNRRFLASVPAMVIVAAALAGCAPVAETGSVVVEVRAMAPGSPSSSHQVDVLGPDGGVVESLEVSVGSAVTIDNVPYGWVSIAAPEVCTVEGQLGAEAPVLRLTIDVAHCTISN
ncbi:hypothetical protein NHF46_09890 [Arthrobacter alpinus]|nr:hypothetical protein [Arthrobacter alpinus]